MGETVFEVSGLSVDLVREETRSILHDVSFSLVRQGILWTPPLDAGLLPGITREFVFEIGRAIEIEVREAALRDDDLYAADEAFLTGTTREVVPVVMVDSRSIRDGRPGPVTLRLLTEFRRAARSLS